VSAPVVSAAAPLVAGDHDRTTLRAGPDRIVAVPVEGSVADHDQTTIGTGENRIEPAPTAGIDEAIAELDRSAVSIGTGENRIEPAPAAGIDEAIAELDDPRLRARKPRPSS
jgi:hypothetical protein